MNDGVAPDAPRLSIVVTIVDGGAVLRRLLLAIASQEDPPTLEVIVPFDASIAETAQLSDEFEWARFLELGKIATERAKHTAAGQHELYDRRRAVGLAAARGQLIAILEDRGVPRADWARRVAEAHDAGHGVVGGAIEPAASDLLRWTFYVCDFGRYGLPFTSGPADWVSDINVTYKRRALEATRDLWRERFREPIVHWALLEQGEVLYLASDVVVDYLRSPITLRKLIPERFHWGRLFGHIRATRMSPGQRLAFAAVGLLIPIRLFFRHALIQRQKGHLRRYLRATPLAILMLVAWTTGEIFGYLTGKP